MTVRAPQRKRLKLLIYGYVKNNSEFLIENEISEVIILFFNAFVFIKDPNPNSPFQSNPFKFGEYFDVTLNNKCMIKHSSGKYINGLWNYDKII